MNDTFIKWRIAFLQHNSNEKAVTHSMQKASHRKQKLVLEAFQSHVEANKEARLQISAKLRTQKIKSCTVAMRALKDYV